jgi:hypothetical protein
MTSPVPDARGRRRQDHAIAFRPDPKPRTNEGQPADDAAPRRQLALCPCVLIRPASGERRVSGRGGQRPLGRSRVASRGGSVAAQSEALAGDDEMLAGAGKEVSAGAADHRCYRIVTAVRQGEGPS